MRESTEAMRPSTSRDNILRPPALVRDVESACNSARSSQIGGFDGIRKESIVDMIIKSKDSERSDEASSPIL